MSLANAFSAGVFLAIALMHILPEQVDTYKELEGESSFKLTELLVIVGYIFILSLDKVLFFHKGEEVAHSEGLSPRKRQSSRYSRSGDLFNVYKPKSRSSQLSDDVVIEGELKQFKCHTAIDEKMMPLTEAIKIDQDVLTEQLVKQQSKS